jgi:hypothetical protein
VVLRTLVGQQRGIGVGMLAALLVVDVIVIGVFLTSGVGPEPPDAVIFDDGGIAEVFGYVKAAASVVVMAVIAVRTRQAVWIAWALLFAVVILDDSLMLHETWGVELAAVLDLRIAGLREQDAGELIVWVLLGVIPAVLVLVAHLRSDATTRSRSLRVGWLFAALLVVAIGLDVLVVATGPSQLSAMLALAEDGGELILLTLLLGYVLLVNADVDVRPPTHEASASASMGSNET